MTTSNTVVTTFNMAVKHHCQSVRSTHGLILHSDRGSQYTSNDFIELLDKYGVVRSNSRKGNCWDNAVTESFFKTLKCELIYPMGVKYIEQVRSAVLEYIGNTPTTPMFPIKKQAPVLAYMAVLMLILL